MPSDMTISKVGERREWSGQHGPMVTYKIELEGHGPAELNQKPETPAPQEGQSIFADLQPGNPGYPPKVKKAQKQGGFNGGGKSPEQQRSIVRQHSQEMALRYFSLLASSGRPMPEDFNLEHIAKCADWFVKDAGA